MSKYAYERANPPLGPEPLSASIRPITDIRKFYVVDITWETQENNLFLFNGGTKPDSFGIAQVHLRSDDFPELNGIVVPTDNNGNWQAAHTLTGGTEGSIYFSAWVNGVVGPETGIYLKTFN